MTFHRQLSLTGTDTILCATAIKSILQKKEEKKAEIKPQQKFVNSKTVLKHFTLRTGIWSVAQHPRTLPHSSVEKTIPTHTVKFPYLWGTEISETLQFL